MLVIKLVICGCFVNRTQTGVIPEAVTPDNNYLYNICMLVHKLQLFAPKYAKNKYRPIVIISV